VVEAVDVFGVGSLAEAVGVLASRLGREPVEPGIVELIGKLNRYEVDFTDVRGQEYAKWASRYSRPG